MNDDKKKQLIAWLENMPWWDELPYAKLEAENVALARFSTFLYGMDQDKWPDGAWEYYQSLDFPHSAAEKIDALLASRNTQEPTCQRIPGKP